MKKIRLDLDAIAVESFPTAKGPGEQGTVAGHAMRSEVGDTWCVTCWDDTCYNCSIPAELC